MDRANRKGLHESESLKDEWLAFFDAWQGARIMANGVSGSKPFSFDRIDRKKVMSILLHNLAGLAVALLVVASAGVNTETAIGAMIVQVAIPAATKALQRYASDNSGEGGAESHP